VSKLLATLRWLARLAPGPTPVVSVYLNTHEALGRHEGLAARVRYER
jgi:hypothetical protein